VSPVEPTLGDAGFAPEATDPVSHAVARRLAAGVDTDPARLDAGVLPPLWHWSCFNPEVPTAELGPDGHPRRRPELDAFPQRMWVGGRVRVVQPLELDEEATRLSRVASAAMKEGAAGAFWLLTVDHTISQRGDVRITEEQDLVFRGATALATPGPARDDPPEAEWVDGLVADPVLLFRFSAVTNNAHRIHYDRPYATEVEGYPDLVVHGPLTALLLAESARRRVGRDVQTVSFRARAPHFANNPLWLTGHVGADGVGHTTAVRSDHVEAMTLDLTT
jgi:3-methylfumaryl-CoA hydratase